MSTEIKAPMTGKIASIVVHVGDQVNVDDEVVAASLRAARSVSERLRRAETK